MKFNRLIGLFLTGIMASGIGYASQQPEKVNLKPNIIGGKDAKNYPFMANLVSIDKESDKIYLGCGGSFIHKRVIITAAHCVTGSSSTDKIHVVHNVRDKKDLSKALLIKVESIAISNPEPIWGDYKEDVALLFLEKYDESKLSQPVTPIALNPDIHFAQAGKLLTVLGWGNATSAGSIQKSKLQELDIPVIDHTYCKEVLGQKIKDSEFCAGYVRGGQDTCQGDSGGPVFTTEFGPAGLIGIISWGNGCAQKNKPGVYASIAHNMEWIRQQLWLFSNQEKAPTEDILPTLILGSCYEKFNNPIFSHLAKDGEKKLGIDRGVFKIQPTSLGEKQDHYNLTNFCKFKSADGSEVVVDSKISQDNTELSFSIKVTKDKVTKTYFSNIENYTKTSLACENLNFSLIKASKHSGQKLTLASLKNVSFEGEEASLKEIPTDLKKVEGCEFDKENMVSLYQSKSNEKYYVELLAKNLENPDIKKYFAVSKNTETDIEAPAFELEFSANDEKTGTLTIRNNLIYSDVEIYSWKLQCFFDFTLVDGQNNRYESQADTEYENIKYLDFDVNKSRYGMIPKNGEISFEYELKEPMTKENLETKLCFLNSSNTKLILK